MSIDPRQFIPARDVLFITLDTLRFDVAAQALASGATPQLAQLLPGGRWEERHSPGSFTFAAHQAFFTGFLPTPARPGRHRRLFAVAFPDATTIGAQTYVFQAPTIVQGFAELGYRTICIGGTGFFNPASPLGAVLPGLFAESHWSPGMGVASLHSAEQQMRLACARLAAFPQQRVFLFINIAAVHSPTRGYLPGATCEGPETQAAALADVDRQLPPLIAALRARGGALAVICSDHGTAFGEDGFRGHRLAHPVVWTVPYAELAIEP